VKLRLVFGVFSVLSVCFSGTGWGQEDRTKQEAIEQMRQVAKAMKQCSEQLTGSSSGDCYTLRLYAGPPTNLEWDVLPSKTVRSPFQGIVEFTLPTRTERIDPPNQSAKAHQKCAENEAELDAMGASTRAEMADELAKKRSRMAR
jgi:hypothetical protein